jgi:hypothetical protein
MFRRLIPLHQRLALCLVKQAAKRGRAVKWNASMVKSAGIWGLSS